MKTFRPAKLERPKQATPGEIVGDLMAAIRSGFYADSFRSDADGKVALKRWLQDQSFLRRRVVMWPATWLNARGVTLPPDRVAKQPELFKL